MYVGYMSYMSYLNYMSFFMNHLKSFEFVLNIIFFVFKTLSKNFREYIRMENSSYKIT